MKSFRSSAATQVTANIAGVQKFELSDSDFRRLRDLVYAKTGIALTDAKRELVYGRLARRLRKLQVKSFAEYCDLVESGDPLELQELTNAITTNLTSFFRENHHFEQLARDILPEVERQRAATRRIRVWSAGCSTGEEPYSIAVILRECLGHLRDWDVKLLATDIDSKVLAAAADGRYPGERFRGMAPQRLKYFPPCDEEHEFRGASDELKSLATFKRLNLLDPWPMKGPFDIVFCRNVIIYFDKATQRTLFERMAALQEPGSWLFIGHSENLFNVTDRYRLVSRTMYQRV
ncbi:MAG TPA: protein-glutamate O-methyltransferase [Steroidobacteraceae bacterium]|jgi:chemotaxis protein methyltransferase CheR